MFKLKESYPDLVLDRKVDGGCSNRRPDGLLDLLTHSLIIEIDEDQHRGYDTQCELTRLNELFTDLGDRPIIFIRLNPDSYRIGGEKIDGCFNKSMKLNEAEFDRRFKLLVDAIEQCKTPQYENVNEIKICFDE